MQIAQVFINELSWNIDNYDSPEKLKEAVNCFQYIFSYLTKKAKEYENLEIFYKGVCIDAFLEDIKDPDWQVEREDIQLIQQRLKYSKNWQDTEYQQHSSKDTYYKLNFIKSSLDYVNETSLAEISERRIQNNACSLLLLNFTQSKEVLEDFVHIVKNSYNTLPTLVHIGQQDSLQRVQEWVALEVELRLTIDEQDIFDIFTKNLADSKILREFGNWRIEEAKDVLPFFEISNAFLNAYTQVHHQTDYSPEVYTGKHSEANNLIEKIAKINGWKKHIDLTDKNKRLVFEPAYNATGSIKYISADTQHLDFECHNENRKENHKGSIAINARKAKGVKGHQLNF